METSPVQPQPSNNPGRLQKIFLNHRTLWSVIGILFIVVVVGSVIWYRIQSETYKDLAEFNKQSTTNQNQNSTNSETDTSTWKTYTSTKYGFSFTYPDELQYKEESANSKDLRLTFTLVNGGYYAFYLGVNNEDIGDGTACSKDAVVSTKEINSITINRKDLCGQIIYTFNKNNNSYFVDAPNYDSKKFDQILSTFKFDDEVFCGGIAGLPCPTTGFTCVSQGNYPDAGTICKRKK